MKFSIAISAYKGVFLRDCIESILHQSYNDFELIVLNDVSPDSIKTIVKEFNDPRIRYYENEKNVGAMDLVDNWNKCLSLAKGEYYMQMGDDDLLDPDYLLEFDRLSNRYSHIPVLHCRTLRIDEHSEVIAISDPLPEWEHMSSAIYYRMKGRIQFISDYVYKTSALRANGGFYKMPLAWFSDDLTAFIMAKNFGLANIDKPVFRYRTNCYSITSTGNCLIKMKAIIEAYALMRQLLTDVKTSREMDAFLTKKALAEIDRVEMKRKAQLMALDLHRNGALQIIKWVKSRKDLLLNRKIFIGALLELMRQKIKQSY